MMSKVSIVVPIYNVLEYLPRCLDSILMQSYADIEVILVNDGSTDGSLTLCQQYSRQDNRVHVIDMKNSGVSAARNQGLVRATGDYVTFIDSDDYVSVDYIKSLISQFAGRKDEIDIACTSHLEFSEESDVRTANLHSNDKPHFVDARLFATRMLYRKEATSSVWGKMYKRVLFKDVQFPRDITIAEDLLCNMGILMIANKVSISSEKSYFYFQRSGSAMNKSFAESRMDGLLALRTVRKLVAGHSVLVQAVDYRLFSEAFIVIVKIDRRIPGVLDAYDSCKATLKSLAKDVLVNSHSDTKTRSVALLCLVSVDLAVVLFGIKKKLKNGRV